MADARRSGTAEEWAEVLADFERLNREAKTPGQIEAEVRHDLAEDRRRRCDVLAPPTETSGPWARCPTPLGWAYADPAATRAEARRLVNAFVMRAPRDERALLRMVVARPLAFLDDCPDTTMTVLDALACGESIPVALDRVVTDDEPIREYWRRHRAALDEYGCDDPDEYDEPSMVEAWDDPDAREIVAAIATSSEADFTRFARSVRASRSRALFLALAAFARRTYSLRALRDLVARRPRPVSHAPPGRRLVASLVTAHGPPSSPLAALDGLALA